MFKARNALVTGGTGGIGSEIVKILANKGIKTYVTYLSNHGKGQEMERSIANVVAVKVDLSSREQIRGIVSDIIKEDSVLDILVNNASPDLTLSFFENMPDHIFERDIDVILKGALYLCKEAVPFMKKQKCGRIINILTTAIIGKAPTHMSSYVISKFGLLGLTKVLSAELAPFNIQVNSVSPFFVETDKIKAFPPKLIEMVKEKSPSGRLSSPSDIAKVVDFLCVDAPDDISGVNIPVSYGEVIL